jgi:hypothetical protein
MATGRGLAGARTRLSGERLGGRAQSGLQRCPEEILAGARQPCLKRLAERLGGARQTVGERRERVALSWSEQLCCQLLTVHSLQPTLSKGRQSGPSTIVRLMFGEAGETADVKELRRAAGEKPEALDAAGVSVRATRSWAALSTGALAGLGGAYLSIVSAGVFTPFMTQGQGYMAIVICMLARGRPLWIVFGSFLFGVSLSIATALQLAGVNISVDVINMLPFVAIMLALVVFSRRSYLPPALCLPYVRGAR